MGVSHLNGWRALEAVLRCGSVTAAAAELGVTPAAAGAQLRGLEDRLGQRLFRRMPGGLVALEPTLAEAATLTAAFEAIAGVQTRLSGPGDAQTVSIAVTQTFAETWLPHHMSDLFARHGGIDLRLDTSWDVVDLAEGRHDFAIRYMEAPGDELNEITLLPSGVVPVCTPEFAARYGLVPGLRDLRGVPIVEMEVPTSDPDWLDWTGWAARCGVRLPAASEAPKVAVSGSGVRIARSGFGLVLGGMSEVLHSLVAGALVMPLGAEVGVPGRYAHRLIWRADRRLGRVQASVRDWIAESAAVDRVVMGEVFGV